MPNSNVPSTRPLQHHRESFVPRSTARGLLDIHVKENLTGKQNMSTYHVLVDDELESRNQTIPCTL